MASKIKLTSNFRAVKGASDDAVKELIGKATDKMHDTAQLKMQRVVEKRGYELNPGDIEKEKSDKDGKITYGKWYGHFFEYGTVFISPMPFMKPGHRAGRKVIRNDAPEVFEKWFKRKAVR